MEDSDDGCLGNALLEAWFLCCVLCAVTGNDLDVSARPDESRFLLEETLCVMATPTSPDERCPLSTLEPPYDDSIDGLVISAILDGSA